MKNKLCRILTQNGYTVIQASNGKEAIRAIEQRCKEISLLLTDIVMPELGGRGLADYVDHACPQMNPEEAGRQKLEADR